MNRTKSKKQKTRGGKPSLIRAANSRRRPRHAFIVVAILVLLGALAYVLVSRFGKGAVDLAAASSHNVLLITLDTTRADHLGCYGYEKARTPRLDGLARDGVRFARAYAPAPLTLPAHTSIMSGLYPVAHGVRNNGHELAPGIRTLAEILKAHGYSTSAFISSFTVDSRFGIDRGFDVYDDTFRAKEPLKSVSAERRAEETFARFSRWLADIGSNRFFAWVHYFDPHLPYEPPPPYREGSPDRPYDGEIAYMDHYVGAVLDRLAERGILDKTLVVVAGDHGEGLGDKVETGHGVFLYEETLRIPLVFYDRAVFRRAQVVESAVRLVDVAPTILDMIGLKAEAAGMQGQSLVPWIRGKTEKDLDCLIETFYPRENFGWSELVGLVSDRWKFIHSPRSELFDLRADPGERNNLFGASADKAGELAKRLQREILRLSSGPGVPEGPSSVKVEDRERLRSLGYVNLAPATPGEVAPDPKDRIGLLKLVMKAQALEFDGKFLEAELAFRDILKNIPDSPEVYIALAESQERQKMFDRAIETLDQGIARLPNSEMILVRLGHTYLVSGKPGEALGTMDRVLPINPRNVDALTIRAGILDAMGRKDEARECYKLALRVEPENLYLRMSLASNLAGGGLLQEAIAIYEGLIADFPEEQAFYQYDGIAHSYLGEYDQAISRLLQGLAIRPTAVGYFNLAVAYEKSGRLKEAADSYTLYLRNSQGESEESVRGARVELERLTKKLAGSPSR